MKKVLIFVMSVMMVMVSGCSELLEEDNYVLLTKEAIAEGEYDDALRYGNRAIEDGYDDKTDEQITHYAIGLQAVDKAITPFAFVFMTKKSHS